MGRAEALTWGLLALILLALALVRATDWPGYENLLREDGPIEYLTALLFLGAAALAAGHARGRSRAGQGTLLAWLAAAALLWLGGEEISWGQRLFGWDTPPAIMAVNTHEETNIHNMTFMQSRLDFFYVAAGLYGMLGWWLFAALARRAPRVAAAIARAGGDLAFVARRYAVLFVPIFVYSLAWWALPAARESAWLPQVDEEVVELLFAFGAFLNMLGAAVPGTAARHEGA